jgi:hypothetical protein
MKLTPAVILIVVIKWQTLCGILHHEIVCLVSILHCGYPLADYLHAHWSGIILARTRQKNKNPNAGSVLRLGLFDFQQTLYM